MDRASLPRAPQPFRYLHERRTPPGRLLPQLALQVGQRVVQLAVGLQLLELTVDLDAARGPAAQLVVERRLRLGRVDTARQPLEFVEGRGLVGERPLPVAAGLGLEGLL